MLFSKLFTKTRQGWWYGCHKEGLLGFVFFLQVDSHGYPSETACTVILALRFGAFMLASVFA